MHTENNTQALPAQVAADSIRILAAKWIDWARIAAFAAFSVSSAELAEFAIFDALVDANEDPYEQECIVYALESNVRRKGYTKPCPPLPTEAGEGKRLVDAICNQLAQRQLWGRVIC